VDLDQLAALMPDDPETRDEERLFLLRLAGDFYIKAAKTRGHFFRRLLGNLKAALAQHLIPYRLEPTWSRLYLHSPDPEAAEVAARIFGIQSVSEVRRVSWQDLPDLVAAGVDLFAPQVVGRSFAVRARRRGGSSALPTPLRSPEVERALGRALLEAGGARVDLTAPEIEVQVDYEPGLAHLFHERLSGPGGLPLGVEGRALVLLSGGFDSAVAAWLLLKRGVQLDYLFCNLGGTPHRLGALKVAEILAGRWSYGSSPRLWELDFLPVSARLQERVRSEHRQVILKRLMLRAGAEIARRQRALALVTGDAIGQVSSQTLHNLGVVSGAVPDLLVLRPLLGFNKEEILTLARRIGIFETAATVQEFCALGPGRPATRARLAEVLRDEEALAAESFDPLGEPLASPRAYALRGEPSARLLADLAQIPELDEIPPEAVVLDLRSTVAFRAWHYPGALRLDLASALAAVPHLDSARTYVPYCEVGIKSVALAERMRAAGLAVRLVRGGLHRLMEIAPDAPRQAP
jgi:thiamine biosynthesis protein ThiI